MEKLLNDLLASVLCPIAKILIEYNIENLTSEALYNCINEFNKRRFEELK